MIGAYEAAYNAWRQDPESFWAQAAESIHWYRRWDHVLDTSHAPFYRWFSGGRMHASLARPPENHRAIEAEVRTASMAPVRLSPE